MAQKRNSSHPRRRARDDFYTGEELEALFKAATDIHEKLLICSAGQLGMRIGEIAHLNKSWLDFQDEKIHIPSKMECTCLECTKKKKTWRPKTEAGARSIPFKHLPVTREVLKGFFGAYASTDPAELCSSN